MPNLHLAMASVARLMRYNYADPFFVSGHRYQWPHKSIGEVSQALHNKQNLLSADVRHTCMKVVHGCHLSDVGQQACQKSDVSSAMQPWYVKTAVPTCRNEPVPEVHIGQPLPMSDHVNEDGKQAYSLKSKERKQKKYKKDEMKAKHKRREKELSTVPNWAGKAGADSFAALRAEREMREDLERRRANQAVLDATLNADG